MRNFLLIGLVLTACTTPPNLDGTISQDSLNAPYPKLIALEDQTTPDVTTGPSVVSELDARTTSLWARISTLFKSPPA